MKFTKETTLSELLENPKAKGILAKYNLPCLTCPFAESEMEKLKLDDICKAYRIDLGSLLKELNKVK